MLFEPFGDAFDDWHIPEDELPQLERTIRSCDDLDVVKASVARANEIKFGNAILDAAIAVATGKEMPSDTEIETLCDETSNRPDNFRAQVLSLAKVAMRRIQLNNKFQNLLQ